MKGKVGFQGQVRGRAPYVSPPCKANGHLHATCWHLVGLAPPERDFHVLRHRERYRSRAATALPEIIAAA